MSGGPEGWKGGVPELDGGDMVTPRQQLLSHRLSQPNRIITKLVTMQPTEHHLGLVNRGRLSIHSINLDGRTDAVTKWKPSTNFFFTWSVRT